MVGCFVPYCNHDSKTSTCSFLGYKTMLRHSGGRPTLFAKQKFVKQISWGQEGSLGAVAHVPLPKRLKGDELLAVATDLAKSSFFLSSCLVCHELTNTCIVRAVKLRIWRLDAVGAVLLLTRRKLSTSTWVTHRRQRRSESTENVSDVNKASTVKVKPRSRPRPSRPRPRPWSQSQGQGH